MNVTGVRESVWQKDGQDVATYWLTLDNGKEVPCYDAQAKDLEGKPLPDGWEIATSAKGKEYVKVPKAGGGYRGGGGGAPAWRNTKEGAYFEAVARAINTSIMQSTETRTADEWLAWSVDKLKTLAPVAPLSNGSQPPRSGGSGAAAQVAGSPALGKGGGTEPAPTRTNVPEDNPWAGTEFDK